MLTDEYERLPVDSILVDREARQRKVVEVDDLIPSIMARGVLVPIIVRKSDRHLIAGERRLTACREMGILTIPVRYAEDLDPLELQIIELEENLKRRNLTWQDEALAVARIHAIRQEMEPEWKLEQTAETIGIHQNTVSKKLMVAKALEAGDESIAKADTEANAVTILTRRAARERDEEMNRLSDLTRKPVAKPVEAAKTTAEVREAEAVTLPEQPQAEDLVSPVLCVSALDWLPKYEGQKFNLLHMDLPYGVELSGQAQQDAFEGGGYDSNEEIYWELLGAICKNIDRILYPSAHVLCWISMKYYTDTIAFFAKHAPQVKFNPTPLVWHKSDNRGILPDAKRGPRNIYEACLFGSIGDRHIVEPVANVYSCPTGKADAIHTNEKPQPMLRHFFRMFVDQHTRLIDPTCGSASALRAADAMNAEFVFGLEFNPEFAERSNARFRSERALRKLSDAVSKKEVA